MDCCYIDFDIEMALLINGLCVKLEVRKKVYFENNGVKDVIGEIEGRYFEQGDIEKMFYKCFSAGSSLNSQLN